MNKVKVYVLVSFYDENGLHKKGSIATINEEDFNPLYMELLPDPPVIPAGLEDLDDVDLTGVEDGDVLTYDADSGDWVPAVGGSGGAETLAELTDVDVVGAEDGQVLAYDETDEEWIAKTIASGGIPFVEGVEDSTKVWSGTSSEITTLTDGLAMLFKIPESVTSMVLGTITINLNSLGAKNFKGVLWSSNRYPNYTQGDIVLLVYNQTLDAWFDVSARDSGKVVSESLNGEQQVLINPGSNTYGFPKSSSNLKFKHASGTGSKLTVNGEVNAVKVELASGGTIGTNFESAVASGLTLGAISDVDTSSAADGKVLSYDAANSKWKATTPSVTVLKVSYDMTSTENQTVTGGVSSPSAFIGWLQSSGNSISSLFGTVDAPGLHTWFDDDIFKIVEFDFANTEKLVSQVKVVSGASNAPCLVFELACANTGVAYLTIKAEIVISSKPLSQIGKLVQTW